MNRKLRLGEIVAWRYWMLCDDGLYSPHTGVAWPNNELAATGTRGIYAIKCGVDMYAWLARPDVLLSLRENWYRPGIWFAPLKPRGLVTGKVKLWGWVEEGRRGYAAQYARAGSLHLFNIGPAFEMWRPLINQEH